MRFQSLLALAVASSAGFTSTALADWAFSSQSACLRAGTTAEACKSLAPPDETPPLAKSNSLQATNGESPEKGAAAQPRPQTLGVCDSLHTAIQSSLKRVSKVTTEGMADNSAPRATMRELQIGNELQLVNIHIQLLAQNKCPPRKAPINPYEFVKEALECRTAELGGTTGSASCDMTRWQGMGQ